MEQGHETAYAICLFTLLIVIANAYLYRPKEFRD